MEYYSAIKKDRNLAICNNMGGTRQYNAKSEISQSEKDKYLYSYME